jgi:3',5'-cyclic AMP phosphodiesterase CpdA
MSAWRRKIFAAGLLAAGTIASPSCRSKEAQEAKPPVTQLTRTPEGCSYTVATPEVDETGPSELGPAAAPPDHLHVSFAGDPSTTFAANWRTAPTQRSSFLLVSTDRAAVANAQGATDGVRLHRAHTLLYRGALDLERTRLHEAHVCGLKPDTTYFYKVGAPGGFSAVASLHTAPVTGPQSVFRFGIAGDARDSMTTYASVARGLRDAGAAFQIFTGDAVMAGARQAHWNAFFEASAAGVAVQDVLASLPLLAANGNHESLSVNYLAQFALPQRPGATGLAKGEDWYAFDYGSAHFVALNDTTADDATLDAETVWLEEHLKSVDRAKTPWLIVYHHRPLYSCGSRHGSDVKLRQKWQPIYDRYKVDLVFNGHDHQYERTKPMRGLEADGAGRVVTASTNAEIEAGSGTVYVVAAGAGAGLYPLKENCPHAAVKEQAYHYLVADVAERKLAVKAYRLDGSVLDQFAIGR